MEPEECTPLIRKFYNNKNISVFNVAVLHQTPKAFWNLLFFFLFTGRYIWIQHHNQYTCITHTYTTNVLNKITYNLLVNIFIEGGNKKKTLFTSKLDLNLRKKPVKCYIWSVALYGAETWTLRAADQKYLESFEMWCWRLMEKISWTDHVRNEEVLLRVNE